MARLASAIAIFVIAPLLTFASAAALGAAPDDVRISPPSNEPFHADAPIAGASHVRATDTHEDWTNVSAAQHPTTLTFSNNGLRQTHEQISFDVLLSADGAGLADRVVHWDLQCWSEPDGSGARSVYPNVIDSTTSTAGMFTVTYDQKFPCPEYALIAWWDGDQEYQPVKSWATEPTTWQRSALEFHAPTSAFVKDDLATSVTVLVNGEPAPNRTVRVRYSAPSSSGPTYLDVVSGPDGVAAIPIKATEPGSWVISADVDATEDTMAASRSVTVKVSLVATDLTVAPIVSSVLVGKPVTVRGNLIREDGRNAGVAVGLYATEESGVRRRYEAVSGSDGAFEFVDTPKVTGSMTYFVYVSGDDRYTYTNHPIQTVTVRPQMPAVTLTANKTSYSAGETATFRVNITQTDSRRVKVTAQEAGGSVKVLFDGNVPAIGLRLSRTMSRNTTIVAAHPADSRSTAAKATLTRSVRLGLATKALNPLRRVGAYAVYRASADPALDTSVRPVRSGLCVRMTVQKYVDGAWRTVATSTCRTTNTYGKARWRLTRSHPSGTRFRIAARFVGDNINAARTGPWTYVRFR